MALSRRAFITSGGAAAAGGLAWLVTQGGGSELTVEGDAPLTLPTATAIPAPAPAPDDRILVVLQMGGGNDGLNTLVPADGRYRDLRPTLAVPESDVTPLAGTPEFGLHPSLAPLLPLWDDRQLVAVQGVGMAGQSRSHFVAMDAWWAADPRATAEHGWLGRWLDATRGEEVDPLRAISLGGGAPALAAEASPATVVRVPRLFSLLVPDGFDAEAHRLAFAALAEPPASDQLLASVQASIPSTIEAVEVLAEAAGGSPSDRPGEGPRAGATGLLATAAAIIGMDLGTRVIHVGMGGFDTHSRQAGTHADLLADVAAGIAEFFAAIDAQGNTDRVVLLTTSEFGRRAAENGSAGTDHGFAGVQFLCGAAVAGGQVVGDLDLGRLAGGDVDVGIDTRSVYAAALDWLGGPTDDILGDTYDRYGLLTA